jgi:outer membrane protein TolC
MNTSSPRWIRFAYGILLLSQTLQVHAQGSGTTLEDLYPKAEARSERVRRNELEEQRQAALTQQFESQGGSRLQFKAGADQTQSRTDKQAWKSSFEPDATIEWRHPLYDGGLLTSKKARSEALTLAAKHDAQEERLRLKLEVSKAFYELLAAETDLRNLEASQKLYEKRISTLKDRQRIGRSRSSEVLAANTQLQVLLAQRDSAQSVLVQAEMRLAFLTGVEPPFSLIDRLNLDTLRQQKIEAAPALTPAL